MLEIDQKKLGFAVVYLMGHTVRAGMLRIDENGRHDLIAPEFEWDRGLFVVVCRPSTRTFYPQAVFEICWTDEQRVRDALVHQCTSEPWKAVQGPTPPPIGEGFTLVLDDEGERIAVQAERASDGRMRFDMGKAVESGLLKRWSSSSSAWLEVFPTRFDDGENLRLRRAVMYNAANEQVWPPQTKDRYIVSAYEPMKIEKGEPIDPLAMPEPE